jgi:hypothetical protein
MLKAITRKTQAVDAKVQQISKVRGEEINTGYFFDHLATEEDVQVIVDESDFAAAQGELVGSVSSKELEHFERIRKLFEEQDISSSSSSKTSQNKSAAHQSAMVPFRPTPSAAGESRSNNDLQHDSENHAQQPSYPTTLSRYDTEILIKDKDKGKGKQRDSNHISISSPPFVPIRTMSSSRAAAPIGNPNSGNSSDADNSDFGVKRAPVTSHGMNGRAINGFGLGQNGTSGAHDTEKGKEKGKAKDTGFLRNVEPEAIPDGFVDDVDGDEDLYND